jgi:hypothetical protein
MPKPTVGRIVHFYTKNPSLHFNGQGEGPYPAIVTQSFDGPYVNLKVLRWGGSYDAGSVEEKNDCEQSCWWVWPPRE